MRNQLVVGLFLVAGLPAVSFGDVWIGGGIGFYPGNFYQYDVPFFGSRNQYIPPAVYGPFYGPGHGYYAQPQFAPAPYPA